MITVIKDEGHSAAVVLSLKSEDLFEADCSRAPVRDDSGETVA